MNRIDVLLASEHASTRMRVARALGQTRIFKVLGETADPAAAIDLLRTLQPHAAVIEFESMDDVFRLVGAAEESERGTKCVVLGAGWPEAAISVVLRRGVNAFLPLSECEAELVPAVLAAARGELYLSAPLTAKMVKWFALGGAGDGWRGPAAK